jgi:ribonuclease HII
LKFPSFEREKDLLSSGFELVIGCDEVGMGCVAGPVVACACVLDPQGILDNASIDWYSRVRDSKTVPEKEREVLFNLIQTHAKSYVITEVGSEVVDEINIFQSALQAREQAVLKLLRNLQTAFSNAKKEIKVAVLIDGKFIILNLNVKQYSVEQYAIVKGDSSVLTISAASILAKVHRDRMMASFDALYPGYDFSKHKGYNTPAHQSAIRNLGLTPIHRKTFLKKYT